MVKQLHWSGDMLWIHGFDLNNRTGVGSSIIRSAFGVNYSQPFSIYNYNGKRVDLENWQSGYCASLLNCGRWKLPRGFESLILRKVRCTGLHHLTYVSIWWSWHYCGIKVLACIRGCPNVRWSEGFVFVTGITENANWFRETFKKVAILSGNVSIRLTPELNLER